MTEMFNKMKLWHKLSMKGEANYDEMHDMLHKDWMERTSNERDLSDGTHYNGGANQYREFIDVNSIWQDTPDR